MFKAKVTTEVLRNLRKLMTEKFLDAYIIPMDDVHCNEYLAACDKKLAFISGFTGSFGVGVVTKESAALWTDGRYFEQATNQMDNNWTLMKQGFPDTPSQSDWLNKTVSDCAKIGFYKYHMSVDMFDRLKGNLKPSRSLIDLNECLVSRIWYDRPSRPSNSLMILSESFAGLSWKNKIDKVRREMKKESVDAVFISALDEIAWLFNLRGSDIDHNPVFFSFCLVTKDDILLFIDSEKFQKSPDVLGYLSDKTDSKYKIKLHEYNDVENVLHQSLKTFGKIWFDPRTSYGFINMIDASRRHVFRSPISMFKAIKHSDEISGIQKCSIDDSIALCQFFLWLERQINNGQVVRESEAADELDRLRSLLPGFYSLSFDTISCTGSNGGIIHYRAEKGFDGVISSNEIYLCDSGAQYVTGTTDVTRTVHFGQPTDEERRAYTLVLKGHITLASTVFPEGTPGSKLDAFARAALWQYGMVYNHGTGHGVGAFLNVHEGPCGFSGARMLANEAGLQENMVLTIEPGHYKPHKYGIRIENDYFLRKVNFEENLSSNSELTFLKFEHLTYFPIQTKLIDVDLMTSAEINWINLYHEACREKLLPLLREKGFLNEAQWLLKETEPI